MSYANSICQKVQLSARDMLRAASSAGTLTLLPAAAVLAGIETGSVPLPRVVCLCKRAVAEEIFDGNWSADATVRVLAAGAELTEAEFHALAGEVFAHFFLASETVAANWSSADNEFTALAVYPRTQEWELVDDGSGNGALWAAELTLTVKCCGSVIS